MSGYVRRIIYKSCIFLITAWVAKLLLSHVKVASWRREGTEACLTTSASFTAKVLLPCYHLKLSDSFPVSQGDSVAWSRD